MFDHAYAELPAHLATQRAELAARLQESTQGHHADATAPASPPMRGQRTTTRLDGLIPDVGRG